MNTAQMNRKASFITLALTAGALLAVTGCSNMANEVEKTEVAQSQGVVVPGGVDPNFGVNMQSCMRDAGYEVEASSNGITSRQVPDDQVDALNKASAECLSMLGYDRPQTLTDDELKVRYEALEKLSQCIVDRGYQVDEAPSLQAFLDGATFDPYGRVIKGGEVDLGDELTKLQRACPQV